MLIIRASKGRAYFNKTQLNIVNNTLNSCRYIYNEMLARNQKVYKRRGEHLSYNNMQNLLPDMKKYKPWLKKADSQALKYACRQVDTAYQKFFKHEAGFPQFHSKKGRQCYTTTKASSIHVKNGKVKLPLLGWVRVRGMKTIPQNAKICYTSVSRESDGTYYISITYKVEQIVIPQKTKNILAMDYKSDGLYVDSDGYKADMPHWFRENQAKLAKQQRKLSKKQGSRKGEKKSGGWIKQYRKVAKLQHRIANQRLDYLHKKSLELATKYDVVGVETLNMRSISNKGFGNGKATMDNGYGMFLTMLGYKLEERGKCLIKVDKWYPSSQICSCCGYQNKELKNLQIREWTCPVCGTHHDRDRNSATNIKHEVIRILKDTV